MNATAAAIEILIDAKIRCLYPSSFSVEYALSNVLAKSREYGISYSDGIIVYSWIEDLPFLYHCFIGTIQEFGEFLMKNGIPRPLRRETFERAGKYGVQLTSSMTDSEQEFIEKWTRNLKRIEEMESNKKLVENERNAHRPSWTKIYYEYSSDI